MYRYDEFDERFVRERVAQFRHQVERRLDGSLSDDEFKPLRLKNGLYLQLHAYMLRVAVPYGTLNSKQMRQLALIAEKYDKGYAHFTTRQNLQYNWPKLKDVPDILDLLADVEMHCIQTSGNCIRNVTADQFAGVAADEVEDPRPTAELIRQWSSLHPEFSWLPRKFKIAVTGAEHDRAAIKVHDIGIRVLRHPETREIGYEIIVGGGLGRTPMIGKVIRDFLPKDELLAYLEAVMRVYNAEGRRDNKYKARVKILVHEIGTDEFKARVEAEYAQLNGPTINAPEEEVERIARYFAPPVYEALPTTSHVLDAARAADPELDRFVEQNGFPHRQPGYIALTVSLKPIGGVPGDMSDAEMRAFADIAERYSFDEFRVTHIQNLVLPHVKLDDVPAVHAALKAAGLATANAGLVTDIIACPGLDYCALATARSIPIAQDISNLFASDERQKDLGPLQIKISGCINACGHHHVGHIGILGLEKSGRENYQITVGGDASENAALGERVGPGIDGDQVPGAIEALVEVYKRERQGSETFIDTVKRAGLEPFKEGFTAYVARETAGEPA
ncbi:nitrite/sulfite reductase [Aureimonas phyllosphaerae]|uniref:Sulfite reductase (NADPH) hemoprotein beta-component n=1 Tax=Aureimonas phyllosphaerae TaxID=1166078 RepID=A0A7W6BYM7_9HYPH|nr:nitrite/sulfite reductase [Aureimonas phyllosphaerae]MBB3936086.1 sulfite reductase (NADPH) hemoprotein beta-component [Aureimonas phyllosphaerae]MBB3960189.1 sulfite reductase (NADPH) hemoprotein beta-component [Aureimonas phyllosphaerae]SFF34143.1 sulfite reductase (NADPH) hemoprotein beta-component [Aureimonas phyllosphaerae]